VGIQLFVISPNAVKNARRRIGKAGEAARQGA
jgi:hypothetical protein